MKRIFYYSLLSVFFGLTACGDDKRSDVSTSVAQEPQITLYAPTSGGKSTQLSLYGSHFGTDLSQIRVTVNEVEALVVNSTGNIITAIVTPDSKSGKVKVFIGKDADAKILTYKYDFVYSSEPQISTFAGASTGTTVTEGRQDGTIPEATFSKPGWLAWRGNDLYIAEDATNPTYPAAIRVVRNGEVKTVINAAVTPLTIDRPRSLAFSLDGNTLFLANDKNAAGPISFGTLTWNGSEFESPTNKWDTESVTMLAVHPTTGNVFFVGYSDNSWIYKYDPSTGSVTKAAQLTETPGGAVVKKPNASCFVFDKNSNTFYITAKGKHVIFKGEYDPTTDTFSDIHICAGKLETAAFANGVGTDARFNEPWQVDLDRDGNLYIADRKNHRIRKMTPDGTVTTFCGTGTSGTTEGALATAQLNHPQGLAFGPDGALYVADYWNHRIRKISME